MQDAGTGMLEDGIFVQGNWIKDKAHQDVAKRFLKASFQGWMYCRDHVKECTNFVLQNGSTLGAGHQTWMVNEINKLIWPAPRGASASWTRTPTRRRRRSRSSSA